MLGMLRRVVWRLVNMGYQESWLWFRSCVATWQRESRRRIDTRGKFSFNTKAVDCCNGYEPITYECLDRIFELVDIEDNDVLIDYGSGKGRVLIEAALQNFKRIEGVEYDLELVRQSEQNLCKFNPVLLDNVVFVHHCDARDFVLPRDTTHIIIWNSFVGEVLETVVDKIRSLSVSKAGDLNVIFALPVGACESLKTFQTLGATKSIPARFMAGKELYWISIPSRANRSRLAHSHYKTN